MNKKLQSLLNALSKEELISIISELAIYDKELESRLLLTYGKSNKQQKLLEYKRLIKAVVKSYKGREGFIPYHLTYNFSNELYALLIDVKLIQDIKVSTEVALLLLKEGVNALQYTDDSNGAIGMLIDDIMVYFHELSNNLKNEDTSSRDYMFKRLISVGESEIFVGFEEFRIAILEICLEFAQVDMYRKDILTTIENQVSLQTVGLESYYYIEMLHKLRFKLILDYGTKVEAEQYVQNHIHFTFFRSYALQMSLMNKDYNNVIKLAESGEQLDHNKAGLLKKWKMARYEGYKGLAMLEEQNKLAKDLLMDGEYMYYAELESLGYEDKDTLYTNVISELKHRKGWVAREIYLRLISDKNDIGEMMQYVRNFPSAIESYAERLWDNYPNELEEIYTAHIYNTANVASNRKQYKEVCNKLKRFRSIAGKESQAIIISQLKSTYKKRPAFLDELAEIK